MTGYQSKKAAAIAKTIDEINWVDHEPNGVTQPAQRPWVGLTLDEIALIHANYPHPQGFALALQAKLKQKNT